MGPAMSGILAYLRSLQRRSCSAILLVHHLRKVNPSSIASGYSMRGSSDLYAWLDSFCLLQRRRDEITLTAEHRSAPASGPFVLRLITSDYPHLETVTAAISAEGDGRRDPLHAQVLELLKRSSGAVSADAIRSSLQIRKQRVLDALRELSAAGEIVRTDAGYAIALVCADAN